nr:phosphate ABC transporter substrate-binding protein [Liquorilactobacillus sicerae]
MGGCRKLSQSSLTVAGSTAAQPIIEAAAAQIRRSDPHFYVNVQGGGSGTGLSQLAEGTIDIGTSDVFASQKSNIDQKKLRDYKIAVMGITLIINPQAGVKDLTRQEVSEIFTGKLTNWQQLGGKKLPITVINRAAGSGTRLNFEKLALSGKPSLIAQEQSSSLTAYQTVKDTPGAISYVAFPDAKAGVIKPKIDGVSPNEHNVLTNHWKLWSYEHLYTRKRVNSQTKTFLKYLTSPSINKLLKRFGFIPISSMKVVRNQQGKVIYLK